MNEAIFKIKNLKCEYIPGSPVMQINELEIPRGKLLFVIGKSGIGKSTFIETLGMMNKTIANSANSSLMFFPKGEKEGLELKDSWSFPDSKLANFRRSHFSFIFQNTNLMPNFTSGENMMMSLLIKGKSMKVAKKEVLRVMGRLSLGPEVFDKKITELSGGQRQRLAFVRAVTADFTVLFGDEPTGNLDENTAKELMTVLKELIKAENKTCIIVSHDLKLTQQFADIVIPITIDEQSSIGEIDRGNIIYQNDNTWMTSTGNLIAAPDKYFNQFLSGQSIEGI